MILEDIISNPAVGAALLVAGRNIFGWAQASLKDGKITKYEWSQLGETVVRVGSFAVFAYFGMNAANINIGPEGATAIAAVVDMLKSMFVKKK